MPDWVPAAKVLHVLIAATWLGTGIAMNLVVLPQIRKAGPAILRDLMPKLGEASLRFGNILGGLTFLTGLLLAYLQDGNLRFEGARGRMLVIVLAFNLTALFLLNYAIRPSMRAIAKISAGVRPGEAPPMQLVFFQKRIAINGMLILVLVVLAAAIMVLVDQGVFL